MKQIHISDLSEELEFVKKAIDKFAKNDILATFTISSKITEGTLFAVRWGLGNDCILVFKIGDEPRIYTQVLPPSKPLNQQEPSYSLAIRVEYDQQLGWIVELPVVLSTGIEYETEDKFTSMADALDKARLISTNTGLPILLDKKSRMDTEQCQKKQ